MMSVSPLAREEMKTRCEFATTPASDVVMPPPPHALARWGRNKQPRVSAAVTSRCTRRVIPRAYQCRGLRGAGSGSGQDARERPAPGVRRAVLLNVGDARRVERRHEHAIRELV